MFYVSLSAGEIHINLAVTTRIQFKWLNIFGFLVPASNGILILNGKSNFNNLTSSTSGYHSVKRKVCRESGSVGAQGEGLGVGADIMEVGGVQAGGVQGGRRRSGTVGLGT